MSTPSTPRRRRRSRFTGAITCAAVALSLAACTVQSTAKPSAASSGTLAGPPLRADTPGVTADTIKLGIAYPDFAGVSAFLTIDQGDFEATYRALIDRINAAGGVQGRKIVPVFAKVDLISPAGAQQSCVHLTQDEKVFAVLYTAPGPQQAACYAQSNRTAVVGGPITAAQYATAQAPWFSYIDGDAATRTIQAMAQHGDLAGRKIAVAAEAQDQTVTDSGVVPALKAAGATPVSVGYIAGSATDPAAMAQQSDVMLQKAQAAGADTLLMVSAAAQILPQVLEKSSWRPRLLFTNIPAGYLTSKGQHNFSTLDGSDAPAPVEDWSDPALLSCASTVSAADPSLNGKLVDPSTVPAGQPTPGASMADACRTLALFTAIADKAGHDLTYQSFEQAGFGLGTFHVPGFRDTATYSAQTPAGAIPVVPLVYDPTSTSYKPVS